MLLYLLNSFINTNIRALLGYFRPISAILVLANQSNEQRHLSSHFNSLSAYSAFHLVKPYS
jgi:hypothetical protein